MLPYMTLHVNLTPELEQLVREKVDSGLYNNASEVVREALRLLCERDQDRSARLVQLRQQSQDGLDQAKRGELAAANLREALELLRLGNSLMEQNLRREHPGASDAEIEQLLAAWKAQADWGEEAPGFLVRSPERLKKLLRDPT